MHLSLWTHAAFLGLMLPLLFSIMGGGRRKVIKMDAAPIKRETKECQYRLLYLYLSCCVINYQLCSCTPSLTHRHPPPSPPTLVTGDAVWMVVKEKKISIKTMEEEVVGKGCSFSKFLNGTKNCNVCFVLLLVLRPSTGPSNVVMLYNFEKSWMFRVQAKKIKRRRY